jgi:hypothetical protein
MVAHDGYALEDHWHQAPVDAKALRYPNARPKRQRLLQASGTAALGRRVTAARRCG